MRYQAALRPAIVRPGEATRPRLVSAYTQTTIKSKGEVRNWALDLEKNQPQSNLSAQSKIKNWCADAVVRAVVLVPICLQDSGNGTQGKAPQCSGR